MSAPDHIDALDNLHEARAYLRALTMMFADASASGLGDYERDATLQIVVAALNSVSAVEAALKGEERP